MNIKEINIEEIIVEDRLRSSTNNAEKINELAKSIKNTGLQHAIVINENKKLLSGLHRLLAYKKLKRTSIPCNIFDAEKTELFKTSLLSSEEKIGIIYRIIEAEENIIRANLDHIEEGEHLLQLKNDYEKLYPETKHGGDHKSENFKKQNQGGESPTCSDNKLIQKKKTESFVKKMSKSINKSESAIRQSIQNARDVTPEVKKYIQKEKISKKDTLKIARLKKKNPNNWEEKQKEVVEEIVFGEAKNVSEAIGEEDINNKPDKCKCNVPNCNILQLIEMKSLTKGCKIDEDIIDILVKKGCRSSVGFKLTKKVFLKILNHLEVKKIVDDCIIYVTENNIWSVTVDPIRKILMQMRVDKTSLEIINTGRIPIDITIMKNFLKRFSLKDELEVIYENGKISITKIKFNLNKSIKVKAILDAKRISSIRYDFITNLKNKIKDKNIETDKKQMEFFQKNNSLYTLSKVSQSVNFLGIILNNFAEISCNLLKDVIKDGDLVENNISTFSVKNNVFNVTTRSKTNPKNRVERDISVNNVNFIEDFEQKYSNISSVLKSTSGNLELYFGINKPLMIRKLADIEKGIDLVCLVMQK